MVTSACAIDKTLDESTSHSPGDPAPSPQANGETPTNKPHVSAGGLRMDGGVHRLWLRAGRAAVGKFSSPRQMRAAASRYNLVGRQTASGEILDTVTATAAHRSLPLDSYAKVTNLGNRRSVIVKIKRPRSIHSRTHPRPIAARCRRTRYETHRGYGCRR